MFAPTLISLLLLAAPTSDEGAARKLRPCLDKVGDQNLKPLLDCFYAKGQRFIYPGPKDLLSDDSVKLLPQSTPYVELLTNFTVVSATVSLEKNDYVAVSVRQQRGGCEVTATQTWFKESRAEGDGAHWRRVFVPAAELALAESDNPDSARMLLETANQWLDTDPMAVRPIEKLIEILKNGPRLVEAKVLFHEPHSRHGNVRDLVERAKLINPDDDTAIVIGVLHGSTFKDAAESFKHARPTSCLYENTLSLFVRRYEDAAQLIKFAAPLSKSALVSNAVAGRLAELKAAKELTAWLTPERTAVLMKYVETLVPQLRGGVAARLAHALKDAAPDQAKAWITLAVRLEPEDRLVKAVAKELVP